MEKRRVYIGLDLAVNCTGYAILDEKGTIIEAGNLTPEKYPGFSKDKYPRSTLKKARSICTQIIEIINRISNEFDIKKIVIEEINPKGPGITSVKALSFLHGMLLEHFIDNLGLFEMIATSTWRGKEGINIYIRKRTRTSGDGEYSYKEPIVNFINNKYNTQFTIDDHDICDSVGCVLGYLYVKKILKKS